MRVALVHDHLSEFGGAERVLEVLTQMFPKAPIYTAFCRKNSTAGKVFAGCDIKESFLAPILKISRLYSPLRFLIPVIWGSLDLSEYDLVITSASWYITRGFKVGKNTKVVCYCHTPPRWLYGFETSVGFTRYWPVKLYAGVVSFFLKKYDWRVSQKIKWWIANSENVKGRIAKYYHKQARVINPPVGVKEIISSTKEIKKDNYFLIVSRLVGAKGIEKAIRAFSTELLKNYRLKIVGEPYGYTDIKTRTLKNDCQNIEFLGRVNDQALWRLYAQAKGFLALAKDEDFGMTVVEAQAAGTPVIAFNGGGFKESVIPGKTGILIDKTDTDTICGAVHKLENIKWDKKILQANAGRFSKEKFIAGFQSYIAKV